MCAPPIPTRCIASRSAVIPARVTLPSIQCHHVWGLAVAGGNLKLRASKSAPPFSTPSPEVFSSPGTATEDSEIPRLVHKSDLERIKATDPIAPLFMKSLRRIIFPFCVTIRRSALRTTLLVVSSNAAWKMRPSARSSPKDAGREATHKISECRHPGAVAPRPAWTEIACREIDSIRSPSLGRCSLCFRGFA